MIKQCLVQNTTKPQAMVLLHLINKAAANAAVLIKE